MRMKSEVYQELKKSLDEYETEVKQAVKQGLLTEQSARTYLLHANNFVKWCKNDFVPGGRKK